MFFFIFSTLVTSLYMFQRRSQLYVLLEWAPALIGVRLGFSTMMATNHDDQLGEIYPTMLELTVSVGPTFGVSFSRFYCCGHGL